MPDLIVVDKLADAPAAKVQGRQDNGQDDSDFLIERWKRAPITRLKVEALKLDIETAAAAVHLLLEDEADHKTCLLMNR